MNCSQATIERILKRGAASSLGLEPPERPINMANYAEQTPHTLAMALVGAYHAKYDLIAVMQAAIEEAFSQGAAVTTSPATPQPHPPSKPGQHY